MSETGTTDQSRKWMAPAGSRRWFWQMRMTHATLFIAPPAVMMAAVYAFSAPGIKHPSAFARWVHAVPWLVVVCAVVVIAHALWRIEVNLAGNQNNPYTDKDAKTLRRALLIGLCCSASIILGGFIILPGMMLIAHVDAYRLDYVNAFYDPAVAMLILTVLTGVIASFYTRSRASYQELEKGV